VGLKSNRELVPSYLQPAEDSVFFMMSEKKHHLTLDKPATYQIKVPGVLDEQWSGWVGDLMVVVESDDDGLPVTTLTGTIDQAALQGTLCRLYSQGIPLISVLCVENG